MKSTTHFSASVIIAILFLTPPPLTPAQEIKSEAEARGAFLITRKKTADDPKTTPNIKPPARPTPKPDLSKSKTPANAKGKKQTSEPEGRDSTTTAASAPLTPIGVGYTLYQRNNRGEAIRVDLAKTFYKDDSVRFVIEPNIDGYLYIFHAENDGEPTMIFPDHRLNHGDNAIKAHVPYEVPSRNAAIPWFTFDENAATENLYIVVTRAPLPNVPTGLELARLCQSSGRECSWKPPKEQFNLVLAKANEPKIVSLNKTLGQTQAAIENEAISRGIKLKPEAPEPSLVQMNVAPNQEILVMKTQLIHR
jgi:hypothetical protein